jgi:2-keto-3-deoxy-L-rhamnonate aldolase RhmA
MSTTKSMLEAGDHPIGTWVSIGHPAVVETIGQLEVDFLLVDTEHTSMSLETVENLVRAVEASPGDTEVVVRVPWNDPVRLKRVVDIGVAGVMVPMVESVDEARDLVDAVRYPPDGIRGIAGSRATGYGHRFEEYVTSANGSILTIAQIETEAGLERADRIAAVDGVDALFVGPADLSGALGVFAEWDSERFVDAIGRVVEAGDAADVPVGSFKPRTDGIEEFVERGFDFLIAGKDTAFLIDGTHECVRRYERALDSHGDG